MDRKWSYTGSHAVRYDFRVTRLIRVVATVGALAILTLPAAAEIYRYTDRSGTPHYVEGVDSVPQEYRASAQPVALPALPIVTSPQSAAPSSPSRGAAAAPGAGKGATTIKYTPGQPIMVDAKINGTASARLLLDTGADATMINPRALLAAGAPLSRPAGTTKVTGVAGSDNVNFVVIDSLEIGDARVGRMHVGSYDVAGAGDGLLGRDFLDRFTVNIDSANGVVTLSPK